MSKPVRARVHRTYYGNTILLRVDCRTCGRSIMHELWRCGGCGKEIEPSGITVDREAEAEFNRHQPSEGHQEFLLDAQEGRCYWCGRIFGCLVIKNGRDYQLRPVFDHFVPFAFTGSCDDLEFVASCQICNGIKSSKIFDDEEMCRAFVRRALNGRGIYLKDRDLEPDRRWRPAVRLTPGSDG